MRPFDNKIVHDTQIWGKFWPLTRNSRRSSCYQILAEPSLDGRIKPVFGSLPMAIAARKAGYEGIAVPCDNRKEAAVVQGLEVYGAQNPAQVVEFVRGALSLDKQQTDVAALFETRQASREDFAEVKGQEQVKRALEIAAAGGHNLLML